MGRTKKAHATRRRNALHDAQGKNYGLMSDLYSPQQRHEMLELVRYYEENSSGDVVVNVDQFCKGKFCKGNIEHDFESFRRRLNRRVNRTLEQDGVVITGNDARAMNELAEKIEALENLAKKTRTAQKYIEIAQSNERGNEAMLMKDYQQAAIHYSNVFKIDPDTPLCYTDNLEAMREGFMDVARNTRAKASVRAAAFHVLAMLLYFISYYSTLNDLIEQTKSSIRYMHLCQLLVPHDGDFLVMEGEILAKFIGVSRKYSTEPCLDIWWAIRAYTRAEELGSSLLAHSLLSRGRLHPGPHAKVDFFEKYISLADEDEPSYPAAHYELAILHGLLGRLGRGCYHYDLGMKSMEKRLSIFPAEECEEIRRRAAGLLGKYHCCAHSDCFELGTLLCSRCQETYYCGSECQQKAWVDHKSECRKMRKKLHAKA